jgi:hypothetical protein
MKQFVIGGLDTPQKKKKAEAILKKMGYRDVEEWNNEYRDKCDFIMTYIYGGYQYHSHDCFSTPIPLEDLEKMAKPKKRFIHKLQEQIGGEIDQFSDGSGMWLEIKRGDKVLTFSFDGEGEEIDKVNLYKEITEVVDSKEIF